MARRVTRSRAAKASQTLLPPSQIKQAGIKGFARSAKAGVGAGAPLGKDLDSSLKRKLQHTDIEEIAAEKQAGKQRKILKSSESKANIIVENNASISIQDATPIKLITSDPEPSKSPVEIDPPESTDTEDEAQSLSSHRPSSYYTLISLYSSFLRALSLHFVYNGPSAPADLREFLPNMERVWRKRKVVTEDIQKLLYVHNIGVKSGQSRVSIRMRVIDYGSRLLLEGVQTEEPGDLTHTVLKDDETKARFETNLEHIWLEKSAVEPKFDCMNDMPREPIYKVPRAFLSAKPKQSQVKFAIAKLKAPEKAVKPAEKPTLPKSGTAERRNSLLDRIKQKALRQSTLAPPLPKEALVRRAAVDRIPDIVNVLLLLAPATSTGLDMSPSHTKKAYKMDTIIQNIRDSMRNPVSKEEIQACLDILARHEVSGGWVTIVNVNGMKSTVLRPANKISPQDIKKRVDELKL